MGTDVRRWIEEYAYRMAFDPEVIAETERLHAHLERCRETGEDPFPDAMTAEEVRAYLSELIDGEAGG